MEGQFRDAERLFIQLKRKFREGDISRKEFIDQLKRLRLKDGNGRFWTIGVRSGRWYYLDGKEWIQSEPPSIQNGKAVCIRCGFENALETEVCARCGSELEEKEDFSREFSRELIVPSQDLRDFVEDVEGSIEDEEDALGEVERRNNFVFHSLDPISLLAFSGTIGLLIGIVLGAFTGASNYFSGIVNIVPDFLQDVHGNLLGGIIYAVLGGALGFFVFGLIGFFNALVINIITIFVGGIKIRIDRLR